MTLSLYINLYSPFNVVETTTKKDKQKTLISPFTGAAMPFDRNCVFQCRLSVFNGALENSAIKFVTVRKSRVWHQKGRNFPSCIAYREDYCEAGWRASAPALQLIRSPVQRPVSSQRSWYMSRLKLQRMVSVSPTRDDHALTTAGGSGQPIAIKRSNNTSMPSSINKQIYTTSHS